MMKSMTYMKPATAFFTLNISNIRWLVTYGILGMKIKGRTILKNFAPAHLQLEIHSLYHQILVENLGFSREKDMHTKSISQ